jgi:SnoaL-like domain
MTTHTDADRLAELEERLLRVELAAVRAQDRGDVENVFSKYMYYHNAFEDDRIVDELWVRRGTEGVRSQYNHDGVYTDWDTIMAYHRGRPHPVGKLIMHYTTTPVIEVSTDGTTAKGLWLMMGLESGMTEPAEAESVPTFFFAPHDVEGKKVWAHWVWCKYGVDFLKQDGQWRIWKFRCFEVARAPYDENWISFAAHDRAAYESKLMYFGDDGKPVFLPAVDEPTVTPSYPYETTTSQALVPEPPQSYTKFEDTFR